ncbi:MAG: FixH family protein [Bacteroidia bacterium]
MKLHFGHGVFFFASLFAGFVIYLVSQMVSQRVDLVEKDYYERGLEYQTVIDNKKNEKVGFSCIQDKDTWVVKKLCSGSVASCTLVLYRPSDSRLDTTLVIPLSGETGNAQLTGLEKGMWHYTLRYHEGGTSYFQQEDIHWK